MLFFDNQLLFIKFLNRAMSSLLEDWKLVLTNKVTDENNGIFQDIFINFKSSGQNQNNTLLALLESVIKSLIVKKLDDKIMIDFAFRSFYKILHVSKGDDIFLPQISNISVEFQPFILHGVLVTQYYKVLPKFVLQSLCQRILLESIKHDSKFIGQAIRCANILCTNISNIECKEITLDHIYICLQSQTIGTRDEALKFFQHWTQCSKNRSSDIFIFVSNSWPWSNKNKFYILASLLENNKLQQLIKNDPEFSLEKFLAGVRLSLKYKNLFSSGQALVRALSQQNLTEFDAFLVTIIQNCQRDELINFNSQWARYLHKDQIFNEFFHHKDIQEILHNSLDTNNFRLIIFCSIFQQQLCRTFHFEKTLLKYFLNSWNTFEISIQFYVYKIITDCFVNSVGNLNEILNFFIKFSKTNLHVPCSDFRNTILNRFPLIFNILAKKNVKMENKEHIMDFFRQLKQIFEDGISNKDYQSLIFSLKLFDILHKFFRNNKRLVKNAKISLNEKLDEDLKKLNVWIIEDSYVQIFTLLEESSEFDDVRELMVKILIDLDMDCYSESLANCMKCMSDSNIDVCCRSSCYAKICVDLGLRKKSSENFSRFFYESCYSNIVCLIENYNHDPLTSCKKGNHLFGWLNSLNELFHNDIFANVVNNGDMYKTTVITARQVVDMILTLLSIAGNNPNDEAPSFQIMEESLEILINKSQTESIDHAVNRKFLLLSFWLTLKACCELATSIGIRLVKCGTQDKDITTLEKCLNLNITVLHLCRHKGAIESAGVSLGKLVREITANCNENSPTYKLLYSCFFVLFESVRGISLTRRGAGLSIMFHHLIKNDIHKRRPLLQHAIGTLLNYTKEPKPAELDPITDEKHENFDALVLHYLCVLIRDSDLKCNLAEYYDEIMMAALTRIEEKEWTIKNAALQLFGALAPKVVGQRQAIDSDDDTIAWSPTETTFSEVYIKFPKTLNHILEFCNEASGKRRSISSIILFLEFLSNIEFLDKNNEDSTSTKEVVLNFRNLFWFFLSFEHEKVRNLSAKCLARFHEFRVEIPEFLFRGIEIFFHTKNENFRHGLVLSFIQCIQKFNCESKCINFGEFDFLKCFRSYFYEKYIFIKISHIVRLQIIEFFKLAKFDFYNKVVIELLIANKGATKYSIKEIITHMNEDFRSFGFELFKMKMLDIYTY